MTVEIVIELDKTEPGTAHYFTPPAGDSLVYRPADYIGSGVVGRVYQASGSAYPLVVKVPDGPAKQSLIHEEYKLVDSLWQQVKRQRSAAHQDFVALPPVALGKVDGQLSVLLMPFYDQLLPDRVRELMAQPPDEETPHPLLAAERLALEAALGFCYVMQGLHDIGYGCTDRKIKDFFLQDGHPVCIDWNVVREDANRDPDLLADELRLLGHLWHELFLERKGDQRLAPYNDARWTPRANPDLAQGAPSVGLRVILASLISTPPYQTYLELSDMLRAWRGYLTGEASPDQIGTDEYLAKLSLTTYESTAIRADLLWRQQGTAAVAQARQEALTAVTSQDTTLREDIITQFEQSIQSAEQQIKDAIAQNSKAYAARSEWFTWSHLKRWEMLGELQRAVLGDSSEGELKRILLALGVMLHADPLYDDEETLRAFLTQEWASVRQSTTSSRYRDYAPQLDALEAELNLRIVAQQYPKADLEQRRDILDRITQERWNSAATRHLQPPPADASLGLLKAIFDVQTAQADLDKLLDLHHELLTTANGLAEAVSQGATAVEERYNDLARQYQQGLAAATISRTAPQIGQETRNLLAAARFINDFATASPAAYQTILTVLPVAQDYQAKLAADEYANVRAALDSLVVQYTEDALFALQQMTATTSGQGVWDQQAAQETDRLYALLAESANGDAAGDAPTGDAPGVNPFLQEVAERVQRRKPGFAGKLSRTLDSYANVRALLTGSRRIPDFGKQVLDLYKHMHTLSSALLRTMQDMPDTHNGMVKSLGELIAWQARQRQDIQTILDEANELGVNFMSDRALAEDLLARLETMIAGLEGTAADIEGLKQVNEKLQAQLAERIDSAARQIAGHVRQTVQLEDVQPIKNTIQKLTDMQSRLDEELATVRQNTQAFGMPDQYVTQPKLDDELQPLRADIDALTNDVYLKSGFEPRQETHALKLQRELEQFREEVQAFQAAMRGQWHAYITWLCDLPATTPAERRARINDLIQAMRLCPADAATPDLLTRWQGTLNELLSDAKLRGQAQAAQNAEIQRIRASKQTR